MVKRYLISVGISKKNLSAVKRDLERAGYSGFKTIKKGKYFDIFYTKYSKLKRMGV